MDSIGSMDLGLLPPLDSLEGVDEPENLASLLFGEDQVLSCADLFQGEPSSPWVPALPSPVKAESQPTSLQQFPTSVSIKAEPLVLGPSVPSTSARDVPTSTTAIPASADESDDSPQPGPKKRRRVRNSKQQELNRLAQQRYRQRKKEKYSELQGAVSGLQDSMQKLSVLEKETQELRQAKGELQQQLVSRDAALAQAHSELRAQAAVLKQTQERCAAAEKQLVEQQHAFEQQRRLGLVPGGVDPQALSDRLLQVIKTALAEVGTQHSAAASALSSEAVVAQISRTLTSCCRELVYNNSLPSTLKAPPADATAAIPVSCC